MLEQQDFSAIAAIINQALQPIKSDIHTLQDDMAYVKGEIKILQDDMAYVKGEIKILQDDMAYVKGEIKILQDDMAYVKGEIISLKDDMQKIHLFLENDIRTKINILAEGHISLNSKLDTIIAEQKQQKYTQDIFDLMLKGQSSRISRLSHQLEHLPCQRDHVLL